MSKVRVFELAKEMGLETSDVEEVAKELGIPLSAKHLTQLASEDVTKLKTALQGGKRASKDTRVDSTIVRRRKRGEEEKGAPAVSAQAASVQVAGGAGSVATSPTTVRRKRVEKPELDEAVEVRAEHEPEPEPVRATAPVRRRPGRADEAEAAPEPAATAPVAPATPPRVETRREEAAPVAPAATVSPVAEAPAKVEAAPAKVTRAEPAPARAETRQPEAATGVQASAKAPPVEARKTDAPAERAQAQAQPQAQQPQQAQPAQQPQQAQPVATQAAAPAAPSVTVSTSVVAGADASRSGASLVQVVRRVDDAIMQNLINEAQRRAERQAGGPRGRGPAPTGTGPGVGPASRRGPRPDGAPGPGVPPGRGPMGQPAPAAPAPGAPPAGDKTGRGRVAWEKHKDKSFDDRVMRMKAKRKPGMGGYAEPQAPRAARRVIKIEDTVTVGELASHLSVKASEIIKKLMLLGEMVTVNHVLDMDTVQLLAQEPEFNFTVENVAFDIENYIPKTEEEHAEALPRDPVVTVMGHVDHGKTSLLDYIRKARVAAGEAGGITQHIGAYKVPVMVNGQQRHVVFLDTPGHAAFTAMRARGAQVTDVVILVVAADDGVMPQTQEAINHAKAAGVPLVVAVNKCDKPDARPDKVRQQLTEFGVVSEEWGGDAQFVNVSAKTGMGIDQLLESVALQSDILELKAVAQRPAKGVVIEAELSKGRGPVATVLVQEGTLNRGDIVVAGKAMGRVRAMVDDRGRAVQTAGPATPVEVIGLDTVPAASERFFVVKDERDGKAIVDYIEDKERKGRIAEERKKVSLDDLFAQMQAGEVKTLNLVIKSDVQGSLEALRTAFSKLKHPELEVRIIHSAVGAISEHDVNLASASSAIIIGFNVRPEKNAKTLAEQFKVDIKLYSVIYNAVDDVKAAMEGLLKPNIEEKFVGRAAVRDVFSIPKFGTIAGCAVLQGKLIRNHKARLIRDGRVIADTKIDSLRRFKEQVTEVDRGHECGAHLENYNDVKVGDEIECYELIEIAQKLNLQD